MRIKYSFKSYRAHTELTGLDKRQASVCIIRVVVHGTQILMVASYSYVAKFEKNSTED